MGKRSFALLLALVLTATLFSACTKGTTGQTETTAKAQTTFATDIDKIKLTNNLSSCRLSRTSRCALSQMW